MKTIYWLILAMLMPMFASCTSSDSELSNDTSLFQSMKDVYGIEDLSVSLSEVGKVPSVSLVEMQAILEALRQNSNKTNACSVEQVYGDYFGGQNETNKKVIMGTEYIAKTRTGSTLENFILCVELKFNFDSGRVYYYGTDYRYNSRLFDWRANGLSLSPVKNASGLVYEFESESFLYFKVKEEGDCLVKVGITFKGTFDFQSEKGSYSFQLQKFTK